MCRPSVYSSTPASGVVLRTGASARTAGQVLGSRPPGSASPSRTWASAAPNSMPGNQATSTAATSSRHGSSTGAPALTTTTVRGLTEATARTSSSCRPGSASDVRSKPSLSTSSLVPTTTTARSASRASSTACASSSSAGRVGRQGGTDLQAGGILRDVVQQPDDHRRPDDLLGDSRTVGVHPAEQHRAVQLVGPHRTQLVRQQRADGGHDLCPAGQGVPEPGE